MTTTFTCEPAKASPEAGTSFHKEVASMMHGFGDGPSPLPATVTLVESIVLKQLRAILNLAAKNSERRGHKCVYPEDIIFLVRNNKVKLQRMLLYMKNKDNLKAKTKVLDEQYVPNVLLEEDTENSKKRKRSFAEIVEAIGDDDVVYKSLEFDDVIHTRKLRANSISQSINLEKYEAYHKARRVSFSSQHKMANNPKLKQWICPSNDINIACQTMQLMSYIAYETVAQIVDLCFLVRQDCKNEVNEPFARLEGGNYCNLATYDSAQLVKSGFGTNAITVAQVREAMRRFSAPIIGINGLFSRNIRGDMQTKFLAL
ncbi:transcription initiation protein Spt3 [Arctopsyche grandis]|uniref:transcription initiation protein Spt3 n=1 Tax=Arctopsyche grandis TaxID=121162 RepID=UPI00406D772F